MKPFCTHEVDVGILFGDTLVISEASVKEQFGDDGCDWFVDNVNKDTGNTDFCYVSEEYHAGEVLYMVLTYNRFVIDAYDTPQEASDLKNKINNIYEAWRTNEICN